MKETPSQKNKPKLFGVGINDVEYNVKLYEECPKVNGKRYQKLIWICPFYRKWQDMITRCYSEKSYPTYAECSVCEPWMRLSVFKAWMETHDWEGKQLDKDLLISGNNVYSPETCLFVEPRVNIFLVEHDKRRGKYPIGVSHATKGELYRAQCKSVETGKNTNLGGYDTPEKAHQVWLDFKLKQAYILASQQTDERVAKALIERYENYKINLDTTQFS